MSELVPAADPEDSKRFNAAAEKVVRALLGFVREGAGPVTGAAAYARARVEQFDDVERAVRRIVRETTTATGSNGFVTGLGGLVAMPLTLPVNLLGNAMLNARMVGAVAAARGWELEDPAVEQLILLVVAGNSANAAARDLGVRLGAEFTKQAIKKVPIETIRAVNKKVGFMLLAKYGTKKSAVTLAKAVPVVGGVVGGTVDVAFTQAIGKVARRVFPDVNN